MSARTAIYTILSGIEADCYPLFAPQETKDSYVVYSMSREPVRTQAGFAVTEVTLTLDIYANTLDACITLASSLYNALEKKSGTYGSDSLMGCMWVSESESYIAELNKVSITQEYLLKFN
jgi:hypothetical protein